ncbi:unnamed protein product [Lactuca saligna]|uniref:Uncharacterized protein n=1 Tax=Lactuca saligna TaxID=75948 RepID=A0AA35YU22_LACSI|nr:unnamed protein product [Lactuca saligna]
MLEADVSPIKRILFMVDDTEDIIDSPSHSHHDDHPPPLTPPIGNIPQALFQPLPPLNPPPPIPPAPINTPPKSPLGSLPHPNTDYDEGFLDMNFMSRVMPLNIIYPEAIPKGEVPQGADNDV